MFWPDFNNAQMNDATDALLWAAMNGSDIEVRNRLHHFLSLACDMAVPADKEPIKRNLISQIRGHLAELDAQIAANKRAEVIQ